jgi:uncharacterized membrane protein (DUF485 family)
LPYRDSFRLHPVPAFLIPFVFFVDFLVPRMIPATEVMKLTPGGVNRAIIYSIGLIVLAVALTEVYLVLCREQTALGHFSLSPSHVARGDGRALTKTGPATESPALSVIRQACSWPRTSLALPHT